MWKIIYTNIMVFLCVMSMALAGPIPSPVNPSARVHHDKSIQLKVAENRFLSMCDLLAGQTNHIKLGFADLEGIISGITNSEQQVFISVNLLSIDAECKREGGLMWWDTCSWHPDAIPYMSARSKLVSTNKITKVDIKK